MLVELLIPVILYSLAGVYEGIQMKAEGKTAQQFEAELKVQYAEEDKMEAKRKAIFERLMKEHAVPLIPE